VAAGILCMWISMFFIMRKKDNIPKTIIWQVVLIGVLSVLWDRSMGWIGWSIDYVIPTVCVGAMIVMAISAKMLRIGVRDLIIYLFVDGIFGFVPIIFIGFFITIFGVSPFYDVNNLFPVLGNGIKPLLGKGFLLISNFSGITILFLINPFLKTHKSFKIVGYSSIIISGVLFFLSVLCYLLVYPSTLAIENFLPIYQISRLMEYGRFFQRIESIFVLIWASSALLYLSAVFFLVIHVFQKTFRLEYYRPLIWPFIIIIFAISLIPPNLVDVIILESSYFRKFIWIMVFIMPIVLLLIARLRRNTV
jgi:hypothetical protein